MDTDSLRLLLERGAHFLVEEECCRDDNIDHSGRRAYAWTLLRVLWERTGDGRFVELADRLATSILPNLQQHGEATIILPGLTVARNFSTNAIDTGIFADSFFDHLAMQPRAGDALDRVTNLVRNYSLSKIRGPFHIINQILWCATGAARHVEYFREIRDETDLTDELRALLERFGEAIRPDGLIPYSLSASSPEYMGSSPYYHGRCIAFAWYIMEKAGIEHAMLSQKLLAATRYLARSYCAQGHKQMGLESKRYYFRGTWEVASNPHDIYCFWRAYETTGEPAYQVLAGRAMHALIGAQRESGGIASNQRQERVDWQCDVMRTGHLAWLARVTTDFIDLSVAAVQRDDEQQLASLFSNRQSDTLIVVPAGREWTHLNLCSSERNGFSGLNHIGLIAGPAPQMHAWWKPAPLHYRRFGFRKLPWGKLFRSFRHARFHVWHILRYRHQPALALKVAFAETVGYLVSSLCLLRSERTGRLRNVEISSNAVAHDLVIGGGGFKGDDGVPVGRRKIVWDARRIEITDRIESQMSLALYVPRDWMLFVDGRTGTQNRRINGPCEVKLIRIVDRDGLGELERCQDGTGRT